MNKDINDNSANSILLWIAENFTPIDKIENAYNGVVYCEIINKIFPNSLKMNKINRSPNLSHDQILKNYKLLQDAFNKNKIKKNFDMNKLMKGRYQDNLEFLQWFKLFYNRNEVGCNYSILNTFDSHSIISIDSKRTEKTERSEKSDKKEKVKINKHNKLNKSNSAYNLLSKNTYNSNQSHNDIHSIKEDIIEEIQEEKDKDIKDKSALSHSIDKTNRLKTITKSKNKSDGELYSLIVEYDETLNRIEKEKNDLVQQVSNLNKDLTITKSNNTDLKKVIGIIQRERDFYYSKLRDIEILLNKDKLNKELIDKILTSDTELEVVFNNSTPELKIIK